MAQRLGADETGVEPVRKPTVKSFTVVPGEFNVKNR